LLFCCANSRSLARSLLHCKDPEEEEEQEQEQEGVSGRRNEREKLQQRFFRAASFLK
jgi:hypothetical protein